MARRPVPLLVGGFCFLRYVRKRVRHFDKHIFVCTNERDPGNPKGDCKSKGAEAIRTYLKSEVGKRGLKGRVRANAAGCLDQCEHGVAVVVYPEQVWYQLRTVDDAREVLEQHIIGGAPVERLRIDKE